MPGLKDLAPEAVLDVMGRAIPYPLYLTRKKMAELESGKILKIISDAPASAEDTIPRYAENHGHPIEIVKLENHWEIYIRKS